MANDLATGDRNRGGCCRDGCDLLADLGELFARIDGIPDAVLAAACAAGPRSNGCREVVGRADRAMPSRPLACTSCGDRPG
jgi:hypothetical protein